MGRISQKEKARRLLSLHNNGRLLVLPNIWDPIGARILEAKGYPAVATASAAASASLGYEDGERITRATLITILSRIARSVDVPVTADIETGFGETLSMLEETIQLVLESGVVGINIEDSLGASHTLRSMEDQCQRIVRVREVSEAKGIHLVINARVDSFLAETFPDKESKIEEAVLRAKTYAEAGADCIYPISPGDAETLSELRSRIACPINVLARPDSPPLRVLQSMKINRVSFGPFIFRSCLKKFVDIVDVLQNLGSYESFGENMMSASEVNAYLRHNSE
jgi:2-methylisocitrate lyase-like PEP mutase family enzyme